MTRRAGRPSLPKEGRRKNLVVRLSPEIMGWLDSQVGTGGTKTEIVERAIKAMKDSQLK
jgi:hypothetical protein